MRGFAILALLLLLPPPARPAEDTLRGRIVYSRQDGQRWSLHVMDADATHDRELGGQLAPVNLYPAWSPDGKRIACVAGGSVGGPLHVCVLKSDGSGGVLFDTHNEQDWAPCWSRDGKRLAFTSGGPEALRIFLADPGGENMQPISPPDWAAIAPFWGRDRDSIGYTRLTEGPRKSEIVLAKAGGGAEEVALKADLYLRSGPNGVSPDGRRLAYFAINYSDQTARLRTWDFVDRVEEPTLSEPAQLNPGQGLHFAPTAAWSPDGAAILVSMPDAKGFGLFRVGPDGKTTVRLTPEGADCRGGTWTAAG